MNYIMKMWTRFSLLKAGSSGGLKYEEFFEQLSYRQVLKNSQHDFKIGYDVIIIFSDVKKHKNCNVFSWN
jgi:hypothetical protein